MNATLYYRGRLDEHNRGIYDTLAEKWMHFEDTIETAVPHGEFSQISRAIHFDYPLLFYINYYRICYSRSASGLSISGDYLYEKEEARELLSYCEQWGTHVVSRKPPDIGDAGLALWLHNVILNNVTYGSGNGIRAHNIAGAIRDGQAVCEGIAMTYKFLCDLAGIPCIYVSGLLNDRPHGWNVVWIGGEPSFVDVTNDVNPFTGSDRKNFLRSSDEMAGYSWDVSAVPECRLKNKSDRYAVAHNKREFREILKTAEKYESINVCLDFGYKLSAEELRNLAASSRKLASWLMNRKIAYAAERQMVFIQK